jgi:SAM-dependent methyltransferase
VDTWTKGSLPAAVVRRIVAVGYDAIGERFDRWADAAQGSPREDHVRRLAELVPAGEAVLEVGCGSGARATQSLADRYRLVGIDISHRQLERARGRVPDASFLVGDVTTMDFPPATFRGVVAFYVMGHVPTDRHGTVYGRIVEWLKPGGWFVANLPVSDSGDGVEEGYLGVPMFFAAHSAEENLRLLREAGLDVVEASLVTEREVEEDGSWTEGPWQWIVANRPARGPRPHSTATASTRRAPSGAARSARVPMVPTGDIPFPLLVGSGGGTRATTYGVAGHPQVRGRFRARRDKHMTNTRYA